jgi:hypothetical protein
MAHDFFNPAACRFAAKVQRRLPMALLIARNRQQCAENLLPMTR